MSSKRSILIALIVILAVVFQLMTPAAVLAQEEVPPTEPAATEIPVEPGADEGETSTVEAVLEEVPADSEVVVVNVDGTTEPLATEQAGEIIVNSDPVWCMEGFTPAVDPDGSLGYCTPSFDYLYQVLDYMAANSMSGNGTVFFQSGTYVADPLDLNGNGEIVLDSDYAGDLTMWGGWNLDDTSAGYGTQVVGGTTTFTDPVDISWAGNVTLADIVVDAETDYDALSVSAEGAITVENVSVVDNSSGSGAYLYSDLGTVTVNEGSYSGNSEDGLYIDSYGDVLVGGVTASGNGDSGIEVYSYAGNIAMNQVIASNNLNTGAMLIASPGSSVTVSNSVFTQNGGGLGISTLGGMGLVTALPDGEIFLPSSGVTLTNVIASANAFAGSVIETDGSVTISNSSFSNNGYVLEGGFGLLVFQFGLNAATFVNVDASSNNGDGLIVIVFGDDIVPLVLAGAELALPATQNTVTIVCSSFNNNTGTGLLVDGPDMTGVSVTLTDVQAGGNGFEDVYIGEGATVNVQTLGNCDVAPVAPGLPLHYVQVTGGEPVELDCIHYSGTVLILPNGDKAIYYCQASGTASARTLTAGELPGALAGGQAYVSAMEVGLDDGGPVEILSDGMIKIAFQIPEGVDPASLAILYWDPARNNGAGEWVELPADAFYDSLYDPTDGRQVIVGPHVGDGGRFEASVNFTGTFVLVQK